MASMYRSTFWLDALNRDVQGWTDGSEWNGWAVPYFEFQDALEIVKAHNGLSQEAVKQAWYDPDKDRFCFVMQDEDEPECFPSEEIQVGDESLRVYSIGSRTWIWEESKE